MEPSNPDKSVRLAYQIVYQSFWDYLNFLLYTAARYAHLESLNDLALIKY